jgi:hypothetical protein
MFKIVWRFIAAWITIVLKLLVSQLDSDPICPCSVHLNRPVPARQLYYAIDNLQLAPEDSDKCFSCHLDIKKTSSYLIGDDSILRRHFIYPGIQPHWRQCQECFDFFLKHLVRETIDWFNQKQTWKHFDFMFFTREQLESGPLADQYRKFNADLALCQHDLHKKKKNIEVGELNMIYLTPANQRKADYKSVLTAYADLTKGLLQAHRSEEERKEQEDYSAHCPYTFRLYDYPYPGNAQMPHMDIKDKNYINCFYSMNDDNASTLLSPFNAREYNTMAKAKRRPSNKKKMPKAIWRHFIRYNMKKGDIMLFKASAMHAGPANISGHNRQMLMLGLRPKSEDVREKKEQRTVRPFNQKRVPESQVELDDHPRMNDFYSIRLRWKILFRNGKKYFEDHTDKGWTEPQTLEECKVQWQINPTEYPM